MYYVACIAVLIITFQLTLAYISIFYHRAFTHRAIILNPVLKKFVIATGNWLTGIEPKTWICMHRRHHLYSDTKLDPHSPQNHGIYHLLWYQLKAYERTTTKLRAKHRDYTRIVKDLDFPIHWLNRNGLWYLPYVLHLIIAAFIAIYFNAYLFAACYWIGMNSHPIQGWLVNGLGHSKGYRTFKTPDSSTNNLAVGYFVMGEGFQNNHHQDARQAKFSVKWWEIDTGYGLCKILEWVGLLKFSPRSIKKHKMVAAI